jgi:hypothetical protein
VCRLLKITGPGRDITALPVAGCRLAVLVVLGAVLCIGAGGCGGSSRGRSADAKPALNTSEGLCKYLQNLPAVESVETWPNPYGDGIMITTRHYTVYSTLLEPLTLKKLPGFVEAAYSGYQGMLPSPIGGQNKLDVYLFATRAQWEDFTRKFAGELSPVYMKIKAGAYYLNGTVVAYNLGAVKTFSVLGHEGWHQFANAYFHYRLPSWLDEGIATQFEANRYENGTWFFETANNLGRLGPLKMLILKHKLLSVKDLIALNPGQVLVEDDDAVMAFYSQSYALVRFLREDNYGFRLGNFQKMMLGGVNGTWPIEGEARDMAANRNIQLTVRWNSYVATQLFQAYISRDISSIEKDYLRFCNKITYRIVLGGR